MSDAVKPLTDDLMRMKAKCLAVIGEDGASNAALQVANYLLSALEALSTITDRDRTIAESVQKVTHEMIVKAQRDLLAACNSTRAAMEAELDVEITRAESAEAENKVLRAALDAAIKDQISQKHAYCVGVLENVRRAALSPVEKMK